MLHFCFFCSNKSRFQYEASKDWPKKFQIKQLQISEVSWSTKRTRMTKSAKSGKGTSSKIEKSKPSKAGSGKRAAGELPKVKVFLIEFESVFLICVRLLF